jgi:lysophospholipase L1-like esterase
MINHAAGGATILSHMAGQVSACSADGADVIILALGTNDNNAGDMAALRAAVEAGIDSLKSSNPGAKVCYMNVLPKWTDNTGVTALNETNIRAAIALACTNKDIPCWDTFTIPWINAADTSDGTHPTAAGHAKIAAQVWARLAGG